MIHYTGNLDLRWNRDGKTFTVIAPISCNWRRADTGEPTDFYTVVVPAGFVTDLASIPKLAQGVISVIGHHIIPAVFHDYCYSGATDLTFQEANQMFLDGMEAEGMDEWARLEMYRAVSGFGHQYWRGKPIVWPDEPVETEEH